MHAVVSLTVVSRFFAALLFLSFVLGQAPHTVHHLFDPEHAGDECPLATAGERLPGLGSEVVGFDPHETWGVGGHQPAPSRLPGLLVRGPLARAPPLHASSLA